MKYNLILYWSLALGVIFFPGIAASEEIIKAKIGIEIISNEKSRSAKPLDRIRIKDYIRIHVIPENDSYLYIIHTDQIDATLVNQDLVDHELKQKSVNVFPASGFLFQFVGKGPSEQVSVICSLSKIKILDNLFKSATTSHADWMKIKNDLISANPNLPPPVATEAPPTIGGAYRGNNPFKAPLLTSSGNSFLVKDYEFNVKK